MLPFEFTVKGPPVSHQTSNRERLRLWKAKVRSAADVAWNHPDSPESDSVTFSVTYYHEGMTPDVNNIIKPIQDALEGLVYINDKQIADTRSQKRSLDGSYRIRGASSVLLMGFSEGDEFLHIQVKKHEPKSEL